MNWGQILGTLMPQPNSNDSSLTSAIKVAAIAVGYIAAILFLGGYLVVHDGTSSPALLDTLTKLILGNGIFLASLGIADIAKQTLIARSQLTTQRTQIVASTVPGSPVPPPTPPTPPTNGQG